jgi:hypothetical protein
MNHLHPKRIELAPLSLLTEAELLKALRGERDPKWDVRDLRFIVYEFDTFAPGRTKNISDDFFARGRFTRLFDAEDFLRAKRALYPDLRFLCVAWFEAAYSDPACAKFIDVESGSDFVFPKKIRDTGTVSLPPIRTEGACSK